MPIEEWKDNEATIKTLTGYCEGYQEEIRRLREALKSIEDITPFTGEDAQLMYEIAAEALKEGTMNRQDYCKWRRTSNPNEGDMYVDCQGNKHWLISRYCPECHKRVWIFGGPANSRNSLPLKTEGEKDE